MHHGDGLDRPARARQRGYLDFAVVDLMLVERSEIHVRDASEHPRRHAALGLKQHSLRPQPHNVVRDGDNLLVSGCTPFALSAAMSMKRP